MQQLSGIAAVLILLCGAIWLLRKKGIAVVNETLRNRKPSGIQQIDRLRLTPQHSLHLIQVESSKLLIAVHGHGVTVLETGNIQSNLTPSNRSAEIR